MKKWLQITAALSLVTFLSFARAEGQTRNDIKSDGAKVLTAGEVTSQPPKVAKDDPNYSIAPEDVLTIDIPHPRNISSARYLQHRDDLLKKIGLAYTV